MHTRKQDVGNEILLNQYMIVNPLSFSGTLVRKTATSTASIEPRMFFLKSSKLGGYLIRKLCPSRQMKMITVLWIYLSRNYNDSMNVLLTDKQWHQTKRCVIRVAGPMGCFRFES
jgi:hypothetical protein